MTEALLGALTALVRGLHDGNCDRFVLRIAGPEATPLDVTKLALALPQPDQRETMGKFAAAWRPSFPGVTAREIAAATAALRYTIKREACAQLCWSGPATSLLGFRTTAEAYRGLISSATRSALVVSFALGEVESLRESLEVAIRLGVQVRFILEDFDVFRQESSRFKFAALGRTVLGNSTIYVWPTSARRNDGGRIHGSMHVKCLIVDEEYMLLTSANWSSAAMQDNMELGILAGGSDLARSAVHHFDHLIATEVLIPVSV